MTLCLIIQMGATVSCRHLLSGCLVRITVSSMIVVHEIIVFLYVVQHGSLIVQLLCKPQCIYHNVIWALDFIVVI